LNFENCNGIQENIQEDLFQGLAKFEGLKQGILSLSLCANFNKENFEKILPSLNH